MRECQSSVHIKRKSSPPVTTQLPVCETDSGAGRGTLCRECECLSASYAKCVFLKRSEVGC